MVILFSASYCCCTDLLSLTVCFIKWVYATKFTIIVFKEQDTKIMKKMELNV